MECERDSLLHKILQCRARLNTYAEAAKVNARTAETSPGTLGKTHSKGSLKEHMLLIYPKGKKGKGGSVEKWLKSLDQAKLNDGDQENSRRLTRLPQLSSWSG